MYKYVVFLKDHGSNPKGTITKYDEVICNELIKKKVVKYYKPKKEV